jgi:hypothetical protein
MKINSVILGAVIFNDKKMDMVNPIEIYNGDEIKLSMLKIEDGKIKDASLCIGNKNEQ